MDYSQKTTEFQMNVILVLCSVALIREIVDFLCSSFSSESFHLAQENGSVELCVASGCDHQEMEQPL